MRLINVFLTGLMWLGLAFFLGSGVAQIVNDFTWEGALAVTLSVLGVAGTFALSRMRDWWTWRTVERQARENRTAR